MTEVDGKRGEGIAYDLTPNPFPEKEGGQKWSWVGEQPRALRRKAEPEDTA